jgi:hypothetical protein
MSLIGLIKQSFRCCCQYPPLYKVQVSRQYKIMTHQPPIDQRIIDEYFHLSTTRKNRDVGWLYGMVATYGIKPEQLAGFEWGPDNSIFIPSRKRPIRPFHSQWVFLFNLKEKQPCELQGCWKSLCSSLYKSMAYQDIELNVTDLLLAHRLRKTHSNQFKQPKASSPVFAGAF